MKDAIARLLKRLPLMPLRILRLRRKAEGILADWRPVLERGGWETIRARVAANPNAPHVVIATTVSGHLAAAQFDALIGVALTLRGVRVTFIGCDAALPACMADQHNWYPNRDRFLSTQGERDVCRTCHSVGLPYLEQLGLPVLRLSTLIPPGERVAIARTVAAVPTEEIAHWTYHGLAAGEHAMAGALRFHARADLAGAPKAEAVLRAYLNAACLTIAAAETLGSAHPYDAIVAHHGIYVPQGLWVAAAQQAGRRVVTWNPGYRRNSFVLSHGDTYHRTMITEDPALWADTPIEENDRAALIRYLDDRRRGSGDWISFGSGENSVYAESLRRLGLDPGKPTILALTSVTWDAQLHYDSNAFPTQMAWVDATIDAFRGRGDINLIFRIHPAEVTGNIPSEQRLGDYIAAHYPDLPDHVAVVPPSDPTNTYALIEGADTAIIYSTKTGVEIAARGIPVVVAGEAWIRGKGFSLDAVSPADYRVKMQALPLGRRLSAEQQERAMRYARHFFFRRMVPLPGFEALKGWPPYRAEVSDLAALMPGADANLDMVCASILSGAPFLAESREG
jgi:hypothetical protein